MATLTLQLQPSMTRNRIRSILLRFRGLSWAAREVGEDKSLLSRALKGERAGSDIDWAKVEQLATVLAETKGQAKHDVNGKSIRSQIRRLRGGRK